MKHKKAPLQANPTVDNVYRTYTDIGTNVYCVEVYVDSHGDLVPNDYYVVSSHDDEDEAEEMASVLYCREEEHVLFDADGFVREQLEAIGLL